jgi:hypothetical protein
MVKNAFEYLVASIQRRRCVPLIGAGISYPSKRCGTEWNGHFVWAMIPKVIAPTVTRRVSRLLGEEEGASLALCMLCQVEFADYYDQRMHLTLRRCPLCDLREAKAAQLLSKVCEAYLWEHGGPHRKETYNELVDLLEIEAFNELEPTSAHFFLAYLAREGLVTEFVTTNYDCNLENAYRATWSTNRTTSTADVYSICDLKTFAMHAAHSSVWSPGQETPHALKVFKINGCAARLKEDDAHAKDILLTSTQLQDWRVRRWAADFFRTKVRAACLVTIGFGSDEPQVVHTLQQVTEEFTQWDDGASGVSSLTVFDAPNAPIVTLHDPYPTFPQLQLLYGFASWFTGDPYDGDALVLGPIQRACVEPPNLGDDSYADPGSLDANRLWGDLFQLVFSGLLIRQMRAAARIENAAFTAAIPHSNTLLTLVAEELQSDLAAHLGPSPNAMHWLAKLVDTIGDTTARPPELTRCVTHLLGKADSFERYVPVSDYGSLFCELAIALVLLQAANQDAPAKNGAMPVTSEAGIWRRVRTRQPGVLEILLPSSGEGEASVDTSVFISMDAATPYLDTSGDVFAGTTSKRLEIVLGLGGRNVMDLDRRSFSHSAARVPVSLVRLDWKSIFAPEYPVRSYLDLSRRLQDAIMFPTKYRRRQDPNLRTNRFLERSAHD